MIVFSLLNTYFLNISIKGKLDGGIRSILTIKALFTPVIVHKELKKSLNEFTKLKTDVIPICAQLPLYGL